MLAQACTTTAMGAPAVPRLRYPGSRDNAAPGTGPAADAACPSMTR
jgi:hypothetical protein